MSRRREETADIQPEDASDGLERHQESLEARPEEASQELPLPGEPVAEDKRPDEVIETLRAELDQARNEAQEFLDGWQRARAEFANYKKRIERESYENHQRVTADIMCRYLAIVDDLERALRERPQDGDAAEWADGIAIIYQKLLGMLEAEGIERIQAQDEIFDPNYHEALSHEESSEHEEGRIIEVIRQGYRLGERVLRPALVRVAK